jgi:hypothetical protein
MEGGSRIPPRMEDPAESNDSSGSFCIAADLLNCEITYLSMIILFVCTNPPAEIL